MTRTSAGRGTSSPSGPGARTRRLKRKGAATVLQLATGDFIRSEKEEQRDCRKYILKLGGQAVNFSQARASHQTQGIPDNRYRVFGMAFWWEVKAEDGQLTRDQYDFLVAERAHGAPGGCGTAADLAIALSLLPRTPEAIAKRLWHSVETWAEKGFRGEKIPRRPSNTSPRGNQHVG